jgi:hypothetical protein
VIHFWRIDQIWLSTKWSNLTFDEVIKFDFRRSDQIWLSTKWSNLTFDEVIKFDFRRSDQIWLSTKCHSTFRSPLNTNVSKSFLPIFYFYSVLPCLSLRPITHVSFIIQLCLWICFISTLFLLCFSFVSYHYYWRYSSFHKCFFLHFQPFTSLTIQFSQLKL